MRTPKVPEAVPPAGQARRAAPEVAQKRIAEAVRLWGLATLAGISLLSALVIWHLMRRGRLLRERLGPPRVVRMPDLDETSPPRRDENAP